MAQQLSGLDTGFLTMESDHVAGHITGVLIVDPATSPEPWTFVRYREHLLSRLPLLPVYTKKLREVRFGLDRPYWVADDQFDLDYHLRSIAVPGDGGREALADLVARIHERPLDRRRPLWESYVIDGVDGDKIAVLSKLHHCAVDGAAGAEMLSAVVDLSPGAPPRSVDGANPPPSAPTVNDVAFRAVSHLVSTPLRLARIGADVAATLPAVGPSLVRARTTRRADRSLVDAIGPAGPAPRTAFNSVIGPHRRFACASTRLDRVKAIKNAAGATVNDVIMAVVGSVLRRWLEERDELPERPLTAMVPLSIRAESDRTTTGNIVSSAAVTLATHLDDPLDRLSAVRAGMQTAKDRQEALPNSLVNDLAELTPPGLAALTARAFAYLELADRIPLAYNVVVSNVAGPPVPLYLAGARVIHNLPVSAISDGVGLNITVQSTDEVLDFGFVADRDLIPDLWAMADLVSVCVDELATALGVDSTDGRPARGAESTDG